MGWGRIPVSRLMMMRRWRLVAVPGRCASTLSVAARGGRRLPRIRLVRWGLGLSFGFLKWLRGAGRDRQIFWVDDLLLLSLLLLRLTMGTHLTKYC